MKILVLCTGNSARSILLEALLAKAGNGAFETYSAGSRPTGRVNPFALELLEHEGFDTSLFRSKSWDEFSKPDAPIMDLVITVCGNARDTDCPYWPGAPLTIHWGVADPAAVSGVDAIKMAAFRETYDRLSAKAATFAASSFTTLNAKDQIKVLQEIANV